MEISRGFTLIELMVTITVAAILLTVGVPSFMQFVQNARRDSQVVDFVSAFNSARMEAVKRGQRVTLCASANGSSCSNATTWETGWIIMSDADGDGVVDAADAVLQAHQALPVGITLRSVANSRITFGSTGYSLTFSDTMNLCDSRGTAQGKRIDVSNQGTIATATGASVCP